MSLMEDHVYLVHLTACNVVVGASAPSAKRVTQLTGINVWATLTESTPLSKWEEFKWSVLPAAPAVPMPPPVLAVWMATTLLEFSVPSATPPASLALAPPPPSAIAVPVDSCLKQESAEPVPTPTVSPVIPPPSVQSAVWAMVLPMEHVLFVLIIV